MFPARLDLSKRGSARVGRIGSGRAGDKAGGRSRAGGKPAGRVRRTGAGRRSRFVDHDGRRGGADVRATFRGRLGAGFRSRRRVRAAALILGALRRRSSTPGCSAPGVTLVFEDFGLPLKAPPPASSANNVATQGCSGAWQERSSRLRLCPLYDDVRRRRRGGSPHPSKVLPRVCMHAG